MRSQSSVQVTPAQERSQVSDKSKGITWLSERRRTAPKSRLGLPYPRTPVGTRPLYNSLLRSREQQSNKSSRANAGDLESTWKGLVNKTWHIRKVAPLHLFSFETSMLKSYSKLLSAHLEAVTSNTAVGVEDSACNVKIQASKNKDLLEIIFSKKQKNDAGPEKILLTAVLFSAKSDLDADDLHQSFTLLPLMLIKGSAQLMGHLINWWQIAFDSCITPFLMSPLQLIWLATTFAGITTGSHSKPVEFVYKVPEEVKGLTTITYSINAHDCQRVWQNICDNKNQDRTSDVCTSEQVVSFISAWDDHFYHHFGVHLQAMRMLTVGTAVLYVSNDGRLKIFSQEHTHQILVYLAEEALKENFP